MRTMGEMADMAMDDWAMEGLYDTLGDEMGEFDYCWAPLRRPKKIPTCKFCGKTPLRWRQVEGKWVLFELDETFHDCPKHALPLDTLKSIREYSYNAIKDIQSQQKMNNQQLLPIPSWDELFMRMVYLISTKSRDPRTKIGAVLVKDKRVISMGYNGFPGGVNDLPKRYNNREDKYKFVVHAEDNTILTASRFGICTVGTILYTNGIPCCECSKSIIQGGVKEIVTHKQWPDMNHSAWSESIKISKIMLNESGVNLRVFDGVLNLSSLLDGTIIHV